VRPGAVAWLRARAGLWVALALGAGGWALLGSAAMAGGLVARALLGLVLVFAAWLGWDTLNRLRLGAGEGAGVVDIREERIAYLGPRTGGVVALDELTAIAVEPGRAGASWVLRAEDGAALRIPMGAVGAGSLVDAFAALPGFDPARAARVAGGRQPLPVWRRRAGDGPEGGPDQPALASNGAGPYVSRDHP
jgi:hypothetical protein